jgi:hypothetical protein
VPLKNPPSNGLGCVDRSSVPHAIASVREATREIEPGMARTHAQHLRTNTATL